MKLSFLDRMIKRRMRGLQRASALRNFSSIVTVTGSPQSGKPDDRDDAEMKLSGLVWLLHR